MLAIGKKYTGKVIGVKNAFDNYPKKGTNERMWCHEVIMVVDGIDHRCQFINMEATQGVFSINDIVSFEAKSFSHNLYTINRIMEDDESKEVESDVCASLAQVALRDATLLHQYQPGATPENVTAAADVFYDWLQKKKNISRGPF